MIGLLTLSTFAVQLCDTALYRYLARALLIPFDEEVKCDLRAARQVKYAMQNATAALPQMLSLGYKVSKASDNKLQSLADKIVTHVDGLDSRLALGYAVTMYTAKKVREYHFHTDFY